MTDTTNAGSGGDTMQGGGGADTLTAGGKGADTVGAGGKGNDTLAGGSKNDAGTIADGKGADQGNKSGPADFPDDWRERLAGGDEEALKRLKRFSSLPNVYKSWRSLEQKLSAGEYVKPFPKDGSDEEKAEWRKANAVHDKPETYVEKAALPNGVVLSDDDKPIAQSFAAFAQSQNWSQDQYNGALAWYYDVQEKQSAARAEQDDIFHDESAEALRVEWGGDFKRNVQLVNNLVATMPDKLGEELLAGRMADGRKIGDDPRFIKFLAGLARELNPTATLLPTQGGDPAKTINDRIAEIESWMKPSHAKYQEYMKSDAIQKEYRDLLAARDKQKQRAA
jgi:hypothetical protein